MAESVLILVRHGETEWNRENRIQGYLADSPLTETGRKQALALAGRLAHEGVDLLYSSDAGRARQTATPIEAATRLRVVIDAELRERNYGIFEGRTYAEIESEFPQDFEKMRARDPHYAAPGGESAVQFRERVVAAVERIAAGASGRRVVVVTHGGVLGVMYRLVSAQPLDARRTYALQNASINRLRYSQGKWLLEAWGDVSHLDGEVSGYA